MNNNKASNKREGSRKVKRKISNSWTDEEMINALHELDSVPGSSVRGVAKRYGIHEATIRFRLKKRIDGVALGKAGRKCVFDAQTEGQLVNCIATVCNLGFSPTMLEIIVSFKIFLVTLIVLVFLGVLLSMIKIMNF